MIEVQLKTNEHISNIVSTIETPTEEYLNNEIHLQAMFSEKNSLCACGCGNAILWKRHHKWYPVRFIKGHGAKGIKKPYMTERNLRDNPAKRPEVREKMRQAINKRYASGELIPPNKGKHLSEETKEKLRIAHLGKPNPKISLAKKGKPSTFKGKHHTEEAKKKLSIAHMGKSTWIKGKKLSVEERAALSMRFKGIKRSDEFKEKRRLFMLSDKNPLKGIVRSKEWSQKIIESRIKNGWKMPIKDTSIERILQTELMKQSIVFTTHKPIFGLPDIFIEPNLCIFADGCYWHGCEICFDKNRFDSIQRKSKIRDLLVIQNLTKERYVILRFWEHDIKNNLQSCISEILQTINKNGGI